MVYLPAIRNLIVGSLLAAALAGCGGPLPSTENVASVLPASPGAARPQIPSTTPAAPRTPIDTQEPVAVTPTQPKPAATQPQATPASIAPAVGSEKTPAANSSPAAQRAAELARADLAQRLGVDTTAIELLGVEQRWKPTGASDSAGQANGWSIDLAVGAKRYRYQVDAQGQLRRLP